MRSRTVDAPPGYRIEPRLDKWGFHFVVRNPDGKVLRGRYLTPERASSAVRRSYVHRMKPHHWCPECGHFVKVGSRCGRHD